MFLFNINKLDKDLKKKEKCLFIENIIVILLNVMETISSLNQIKENINYYCVVCQGIVRKLCFRFLVVLNHPELTPRVGYETRLIS